MAGTGSSDWDWYDGAGSSWDTWYQHQWQSSAMWEDTRGEVSSEHRAEMRKAISDERRSCVDPVQAQIRNQEHQAQMNDMKNNYEVFIALTRTANSAAANARLTAFEEYSFMQHMLSQEAVAEEEIARAHRMTTEYEQQMLQLRTALDKCRQLHMDLLAAVETRRAEVIRFQEELKKEEAVVAEQQEQPSDHLGVAEVTEHCSDSYNDDVPDVSMSLALVTNFSRV